MSQEDNFLYFPMLNIKMETKKKIVIFILVIFIVALVAGGIYLVITPSSKQATTPSASVSSVNPCATYTDTSFNISRECILHMWNNIAGCPNTPSDIIDYYAQTTKQVGAPSITINGSSVASASRTLGAMKADAKLWATLPDNDRRTACYGTDRTKWPYTPLSKGVEKTTNWDSSGGGNAYFLDRHLIDCENKPINKLKLETQTSNGSTNIRYNYTCSKDGNLLSEVSKSNSPTEASTNTIFLDRQYIDCGNNKLLSGMKLTISPDKTWKYDYKCKESTRNLTCRDDSTNWNSEGDGNVIFLDRHDIKCNDDESLSKIHLTRKGDGNYRYDFTCCKYPSPSTTSPVSRINTPQYLRHLQNKNYVLY